MLPAVKASRLPITSALRKRRATHEAPGDRTEAISARGTRHGPQMSATASSTMPAAQSGDAGRGRDPSGSSASPQIALVARELPRKLAFAFRFAARRGSGRLGILCALTMAPSAGLLPALKAARLPITSALRSWIAPRERGTMPVLDEPEYRGRRARPRLAFFFEFFLFGRAESRRRAQRFAVVVNRQVAHVERDRAGRAPSRPLPRSRGFLRRRRGTSVGIRRPDERG